MSLIGPRDDAQRKDDAAVDDYVRFHFRVEPDDEPAPTVPTTSTTQAYPNVHQGARQTAEPNEDVEFNAYMRMHFPQLRDDE